MPHRPKKNAVMIPKIAAMAPPPMPGPMYENTGVKNEKIYKNISYLGTTFNF